MKDIAEVLTYLPHRYPFMLVDRVLSVTAGDVIEGFKNVTFNEDFFNGHFPGEPVMPGVLIVEAMAQLSGVLAFETKGTRPSDGYMYYFAGISDTRFKRPVVPGDRLMMRSQLLVDRSGVFRFQCEASVDDEEVCRSVITVVERKV